MSRRHLEVMSYKKVMNERRLKRTHSTRGNDWLIKVYLVLPDNLSQLRYTSHSLEWPAFFVRHELLEIQIDGTRNVPTRDS